MKNFKVTLNNIEEQVLGIQGPRGDLYIQKYLEKTIPMISRHGNLKYI